MEVAEHQVVEPAVVGAEFILLCEGEDFTSSVLFAASVEEDGRRCRPTLATAQTIKDVYKFPFEIRSRYYFAFRAISQIGYENSKWDIRPLLEAKGIDKGSQLGHLSVTLDELLSACVQS
jgi:hypothetical protein